LTVQLSPRVVDAALLGLQSCKMLAVIWCWNQLLELSTPTQLHVAANVRNTPDYALLCRLYRLWRWLPTPAPQQVTRKASATEVSPHTAKMSCTTCAGRCIMRRSALTSLQHLSVCQLCVPPAAPHLHLLACPAYLVGCLVGVSAMGCRGEVVRAPLPPMHHQAAQAHTVIAPP
jgi:hypothetical protein